jgi:hypothetical protein
MSDDLPWLFLPPPHCFFFYFSLLFVLRRSFEECVQLPVLRTDDLTSTIYCLQRENLILSPSVLEILQSCLDVSIYGRYLGVNSGIPSGVSIK